MKKIFLISATVLSVMGYTAKAQKEPSKENYSQPIAYSNSFNKIVVEDDIDLVLTEGSSKNLEVSGRQRNVDKLVSRTQDGTLYLGSKDGSLKGLVRVSVPVQHLQQITINGNSWVKSKGHLNSTSLQIHVNGEAMVSVTNSGQIFVRNSKDIELDIKKSTGGVSFERAKSK